MCAVNIKETTPVTILGAPESSAYAQISRDIAKVINHSKAEVASNAPNQAATSHILGGITCLSMSAKSTDDRKDLVDNVSKLCHVLLQPSSSHSYCPTPVLASHSSMLARSYSQYDHSRPREYEEIPVLALHSSVLARVFRQSSYFGPHDCEEIPVRRSRREASIYQDDVIATFRTPPDIFNDHDRTSVAVGIEDEADPDVLAAATSAERILHMLWTPFFHPPRNPPECTFSRAWRRERSMLCILGSPLAPIRRVATDFGSRSVTHILRHGIG
jgi:hypothetical protein